MHRSWPQGRSANEYNLISLFYYATETAQTCGRYARDAKHESAVRDFFEQARVLNLAIAEEAQRMLEDQIGTSESALRGDGARAKNDDVMLQAQ